MSRTVTFKINAGIPAASSGRSDGSFEEAFRTKTEELKAETAVRAPPIPRSFRPELVPGLESAADTSIAVVRNVSFISSLPSSFFKAVEVKPASHDVYGHVEGFCGLETKTHVSNPVHQIEMQCEDQC